MSLRVCTYSIVIIRHYKDNYNFYLTQGNYYIILSTLLIISRSVLAHIISVYMCAQYPYQLYTYISGEFREGSLSL